MAFFRYKVLSSNSKDTHEILIEADSNNEAVNKIKARNLIPISFLGEADLPEWIFPAPVCLPQNNSWFSPNG